MQKEQTCTSRAFLLLMIMNRIFLSVFVLRYTVFRSLNREQTKINEIKPLFFVE